MKIFYAFLLVFSLSLFSRAQDVDQQKLFEIANEGNSFLSSGEYSEAIKKFNEALILDPDNYYLFQLKAKANYYMNDLKLGLANIERSIKLNKGDADSWYLKAIIHRDLHAYEDALRAISKARLLDSLSPDYAEMESLLALQTGDYSKALRNLSLMDVSEKHKASSNYIRAFVEYKKGNFLKSNEICTSSLEFNLEGAHRFFYILANNYLQLKDYAKALQAVDNCLKVFPDEIKYYELRTRIMQRRISKSILENDLNSLKFTSEKSMDYRKLIKNVVNKQGRHTAKKAWKHIRKKQGLCSLDYYFSVYLYCYSQEDYPTLKSEFSRKVNNLLYEGRVDEVPKLASEYSQQDQFLLEALYEKSQAYLRLGDYQQARDSFFMFYSYLFAIIAGGDGSTMDNAVIAFQQYERQKVLEYYEIKVDKSTLTTVNGLSYMICSYEKNGEDFSFWFLIDASSAE